LREFRPDRRYRPGRGPVHEPRWRGERVPLLAPWGPARWRAPCGARGRGAGRGGPGAWRRWGRAPPPAPRRRRGGSAPGGGGGGRRRGRGRGGRRLRHRVKTRTVADVPAGGQATVAATFPAKGGQVVSLSATPLKG